MTTVRSDPCLARYDYPTSAKTSQKPKVTFSDENVEFPPSYSVETTTADSNTRPQSADRYFPSNSRQYSSNVDQNSASTSRQFSSRVEDNFKPVLCNVVTKPSESQQPTQKPFSNKNSASELRRSNDAKINSVLQAKENDERRFAAVSNKKDFSSNKSSKVVSSDQGSSHTDVKMKEYLNLRNLNERKLGNRQPENRDNENAPVSRRNDVDAGDNFVGEDFNHHNSSNLRRFLIRSSQSRQTVDDVSEETFNEGL
jgi:hypothetical protein